MEIHSGTFMAQGYTKKVMPKRNLCCIMKMIMEDIQRKLQKENYQAEGKEIRDWLSHRLIMRLGKKHLQ